MTAEVRKLRHVDIEKVPKRSTLSDANARRDEKLFEEECRDLYERWQRKAFFGQPKKHVEASVSNFCNN